VMVLTGAESEWKAVRARRNFSPSAGNKSLKGPRAAPTAAFLTKPPSAANCEFNSSNLLLPQSSTASSYHYLKRTHV